jgi:tetratricopeptide (TPR) repeat protein
MSLFRDVAEKLGVAVEGAPLRAHSGSGFSSFRELLDHLHRQWRNDRVPGRRMILVLDALNEAPFAEQVIREALALVKVAACFPWCKVVLSLRQEWLGIWFGKMGGQEISPLEEARPFLYVAEPAGERGIQGPPIVPLEPFTAEQAAAAYRHYQGEARTAREDGRSYAIPACRTPWEEVPAATRDLLQNPLYLHLSMEAFDGRPAEAVATVPALFRHYVDRSLQPKPALRQAVETVVGHLLLDLNRPSADLSDDDSNAIRRAWAGALLEQEARLSLSPVEALVHEGFLSKRVREEGGGYRFVFQTVAEYLIYFQLVMAGRGEDELAFWKRHAVPDRVFPEYAGAFGFLLRDWVAAGKLEQAAALVEASPDWLADVLTTCLVEQGRSGHVPGHVSPAAVTAAHALSSTGGKKCARAPEKAGFQLMRTGFGLTVTTFFRSCLSLRLALWKADPKDVPGRAGLISALINLGSVLGATGRVAEAESVFRTVVAIRLELGDDDAVAFGDDVGLALNNLGVLLRAAGRRAEAERAFRFAVELYEPMWAALPDQLNIGECLASALNHLSALLGEAGQVAEAERASRRAVEINEALWAANPDHVDTGDSLARALGNQGNLLSDAGRAPEAEQALHRAVEIYEALWAANPDHVGIGDGLGRALINVGVLLTAACRFAEAVRAYRRAAEIYEPLWAASPDREGIGDGLARALGNLGILLSAWRQEVEAERVYRRGVEIYEALGAANRENVDSRDGLATALLNLGNLLSAGGRAAEAERAYRRAVDTYAALWAGNPGQIEIKLRYAGSLCSVGRWDEAERLVNEVLGQVPQHPFANQVRRYIERHRSGR